MTTRVLFVCTGNICRSAFAQAAAEYLFETAGVAFTSAGTHAMTGEGATSTMRVAAAELGIDLSTHRSTALRDCDQPDLVFGMEGHHLVAVSRRFPDLPVTDIRLLDHPRAIEDPYGLDLDAYRHTVGTVMRALKSISFTLKSISFR